VLVAPEGLIPGIVTLARRLFRRTTSRAEPAAALKREAI
jgi:hypothetical protein